MQESVDRALRGVIRQQEGVEILARVYRQGDGDRKRLNGHGIVVVGYGNQGRSQALNLRDSGLDIRIGNINDDYRRQAEADGFTVQPIREAVAKADIVLLLIPDEIMTDVFARDIAPALSRGATLVFASGYNVAFGLIDLPEGVDCVLLAPRMVGRGVRELYQSGAGFFSFVAVERDVSGRALQIVLDLADGIGSLAKGAVEVTFRMEAELDLFNEQGFGPAFGRVLLASVDTLIEAGYPKEVVLLEVFASGELAYICQQFSETGLLAQLDHHSQTSQYGAISRGIEFLSVNLKRPMRKILEKIRSGAFAREWTWEKRTGKLRYRLLRALALRQPIRRLEQEARIHLGLET